MLAYIQESTAAPLAIVQVSIKGMDISLDACQKKLSHSFQWKTLTNMTIEEPPPTH